MPGSYRLRGNHIGFVVQPLANRIQPGIEWWDRLLVVRVVDRYLVREFLKALFVVVTMFYALGAVIVSFEEIDTFLEKKAPFLVALEFVVRSAPYRLAEGGPLVMLLVSVFSIGRLVYGRELDAMIIGGYRLRRLVLPLGLASIFCAVFYFVVCEYIICPWMARAEDLMDMVIRGKEMRRGVWMWGQNRKKYFVQRFQPVTYHLEGVFVIEMAPDEFRPTRRIQAREGDYDASAGVWHMKDGREWTFGPEGQVRVETFDERTYLLEEGPRDFALVSQDEDILTYADLSHLVTVISRGGGDPIAYLPHLRLREALPFGLIVMSMLGVAVAVRTGRGGYVLGLGMSVLVALLFYGVLLFCHSCAKKGLLPAWLAAWMPNILFGAVTALELHRLDRTT